MDAKDNLFFAVDPGVDPMDNRFPEFGVLGMDFSERRPVDPLSFPVLQDFRPVGEGVVAFFFVVEVVDVAFFLRFF